MGTSLMLNILSVICKHEEKQRRVSKILHTIEKNKIIILCIFSPNILQPHPFTIESLGILFNHMARQNSFMHFVITVYSLSKYISVTSFHPV